MFRTHLLDECHPKAEQRLEQERRIHLQKVIHALALEGPRLGLREAYVVGSVTQEDAWTDDSDVDVAMSGGDPLELMKILEQSVGRPVDVIDLDAHPVPEMFRRRGIKVVG
jgi:predicted nucleotidyltransferase